MSDKPTTPSWRELFEKTVDLGLGAALLTKEAAGRLVDDLVKRGTMTKEDGQKLVSQMLEKGKQQKEKMDTLVHQAIERMVARGDLARQSALEQLERRVKALEEELKGRPSPPGANCL
jgi:polyhydroxyalkanoate synthesis regulator phasin